MGTQHRFDPPGGWHHVMHRGSRRQTIVADDHDRRRLLGCVDKAFEPDGIEVHAFAVMNNHYHLLVRCPDGGLSAAMQRLNATYARGFNQRHELTGHLFGGRFRSIYVDDQTYLVDLARYIHRNPVAAGLCASPGQFAWSSHRAYLGRAATPSFLVTEVVLSYFGSSIARFDAFVQAPDTARARAVHTATERHVPALVEGHRFSDLLADADVAPSAEASVRRLRPVDAVARHEQLVVDALGIDSLAVLLGDPLIRRRHLPVLVASLHRQRGLSYRALAARYGFGSISSIHRAIARAEAQAAADPVVANLIADGDWQGNRSSAS